jgi:hypothetical protein
MKPLRRRTVFYLLVFLLVASVPLGILLLSGTPAHGNTGGTVPAGTGLSALAAGNVTTAPAGTLQTANASAAPAVPGNARRAPSLLGLADYWAFDEGSGQTAGDGTVHGYTGTLNSGARWTEGKYGSGIAFNGPDNYVRVTRGNGSVYGDNFTVSLWINPASWATNEELLSDRHVQVFHRGNWAGDAVYFLLKINASEPAGDSSRIGWAGVKTTRVLSANRWSSVIGVKSGRTMTIYLNGARSQEFSIPVNYTLDNSAPGDLFIGGSGAVNFEGTIDEVSIWNRALSADEVQGLYEYPPMLLPPGNRNVTAGSPIRFTVTGVDVQNRSLAYTASALPAGASLTPLPEAGIFAPYSSGEEFSWTPAAGQVGSHLVCFGVSNGVSDDSDCIRITVNPSCIPDATICPDKYVCRGDGVCTKNVTRHYGAEAKPTADPVGGGVNYHDIVDPASADFIVGTHNELLDALHRAAGGQVIYIRDDAAIDLSGDTNLVIPGNVTIAGGRGRAGSQGALLYSNTLGTYPLFVTGGDGVRITGLRIQGPDPEQRTDQMTWLAAQGRYYEIPNSEGIRATTSGLTVDNCEVSGWSYAAISLREGSKGNRIHHNYIHHNQRLGLGYGVAVFPGADALIEANVFDWNRHSIEGVNTAAATSSYEAAYNVVLGNANGDYFDIDGGNDEGDAAVPAGGAVKIHHNTFTGSTYPAVGVQGIPQEAVWVYNNWAAYDTNAFIPKMIFRQYTENISKHPPYERVNVYDNWFGYERPD